MIKNGLYIKKQQSLYKGLGTYKKKMTLIIGIKLKDSILLVGDRKVSTGNDRPFYADKIEMPFENAKMAVAAAGLQDLSKEFNRKIVNQVNSRNAEFRLLNIKSFNNTGISFNDIKNEKIKDYDPPFVYNAEIFLDDCSAIIRQLSEIAKEIDPNPIEALVAVYTNKFSLYRIINNGFKQEGNCFAIGSGGVHVEEFLSQMDTTKLTIGEAIRFCTFLIKYVELMRLDDGVGIEEGKLPQIILISKDSAKEYEIKNKLDSDFILKNVIQRIKKIQKQFIFGK